MEKHQNQNLQGDEANAGGAGTPKSNTPVADQKTEADQMTEADHQNSTNHVDVKLPEENDQAAEKTRVHDHQDKDIKVEEKKIEEIVDPVPDPLLTLEQVSEDIDKFLASPPVPRVPDQGIEEDNGAHHVDIPEFIGKFLDLLEAKISKYDSGETKVKWCQVPLPEEDLSFLQAFDRVSKLNQSLRHLKLEEKQGPLMINRIGSIQQRAMSYLEEEFRLLLEESKTSDLDTVPDAKGKQEPGDRVTMPEAELPAEDHIDFPGFSEDIVSSLHKIAKEMISAGYEFECCQVYIVSRRNAFEEVFHKLGFEKHSMDDVQKMHWESLERDIASWIKTFKQCATVCFSGERNLAGSVFSDYPSICASLFSNLTRGIVIQLLNFAEGISMTKRSAEKLFKLLDMYETLRDMVPKMDCLFTEDCANELKSETTTARSRLGETAICIFCDLENSIKTDAGKTPVPGGAVHPLTRYIMNYLKYACEYKDTLEQVFKEHSKMEHADSTSGPHREGESAETSNNNNNAGNHSPFAVQLMRMMDLLDANLEIKSKLYRDVALSLIFMMNNGRYILQKIKGSTEIHDLMGDTWYRKRSSDLRQYHRNYMQETWVRLLGCLNHEGLNVNGKVVKPVLKERFKSFNATFEEIHKAQSSWVVSDEQLQSELRVSISGVVIPGYRSFLGRFSQYLDAGRQTEKYIKYQPDDIETYIDELFDGNATPNARRR